MTASGQTTSRATGWPSIVVVVLTLAALATVHVTVSALLGVGDQPLAVTWQNAVALALVAGVAWPVWRWLDAGVHDLASQHHEPYTAIQALSASTSAPSLAGAIARAAHLGWVEVELDGTESVGHRDRGAASIEIPISYDDQQLGFIRTAERRPGRGLTRADHDVLRELANQLALRVVAERAAARVAESRTRIVAVREEERLRIRRDLHDGLAPSLASIQLQLKALQRGLGEDHALRATIDGLLTDLAQTSAELRRLVYGLRPPLLDDLGLAGALQHQFAGIERPRLQLEVRVTDLPAAVEVALLRIATEAVHNVVKHAGADRARVAITQDGDLVRLTVADDGIGMPADVVAGVGLSAMRERAEEIGGILSVLRTPGGGTTVAAELRVAR